MEKWFHEENEIIAFEIDTSDEKKIAQTIVSFSNHKGGSIFFGVNSKSKIVGCYPKEIIDSVSHLARSFCSSFEIIEPIIHEFKSKFVVEFHIMKSSVPTRLINMEADNGYYIRYKSENQKQGKILSNYFHMLSKPVVNNRIDAFASETLLSLIKKNESCTLAQLYKSSDLEKSEIDQILPVLLYMNQINYRIVDSVVRFY